MKTLTLNNRITEKAALGNEKNVYTFDVPMDTNKIEVAREIKRLYKVTPIKVNIVRTIGKTKMVRGKWGSTSATKKAYVFLKKGDSITQVETKAEDAPKKKVKKDAKK